MEPPDVDLLQKRCEELSLSHEAQAHRMDQLEQRLDAKLDQKLSTYTQQTQTNIEQLLAAKDKSIQAEQRDFYIEIALLVKSSIAGAMESYNKESRPENSEMNITGSNTLPQKRNEPSSPQSPHKTLGCVKPSDWIQKQT